MLVLFEHGRELQLRFSGMTIFLLPSIFHQFKIHIAIGPLINPLIRNIPFAKIAKRGIVSWLNLCNPGTEDWFDWRHLQSLYSLPNSWEKSFKKSLATLPAWWPLGFSTVVADSSSNWCQQLVKSIYNCPLKVYRILLEK